MPGRKKFTATLGPSPRGPGVVPFPARPPAAGYIHAVPDFATSIDRLLNLVHHWAETRWSAPSGTGSRAEMVYTLVQRLADLGAEAEHRPPRPVPRAHCLVLPDQLRVMADDILAAGPSDDLLARATTEVDRVRQALS
jgi:hypothetical protein